MIATPTTLGGGSAGGGGWGGGCGAWNGKVLQWTASSTPNKDILLDLVPQDEAGFVPSNGLHNGGYQWWPGYFMAGGRGTHYI